MFEGRIKSDLPELCFLTFVYFVRPFQDPYKKQPGSVSTRELYS